MKYPAKLSIFYSYFYVKYCGNCIFFLRIIIYCLSDLLGYSNAVITLKHVPSSMLYIWLHAILHECWHYSAWMSFKMESWWSAFGWLLNVHTLVMMTWEWWCCGYDGIKWLVEDCPMLTKYITIVHNDNYSYTNCATLWLPYKDVKNL